MDQTTKSRAATAMLIFMAANGVLFGVGLIVALVSVVPGAGPWIPVALIGGSVLAVPVARDIVRKLRTHGWPMAAGEPASLRVQYRGYHRG